MKNSTTQLFVPGRVCLFGEHSDWAGGHRRVNAQLEKGYAIIVGTNQGIYATVSPHADSLILTSVKSNGKKVGPEKISMKPDALLQTAREGGFWSYIAGVAHYMQKKCGVKGLLIDNFKTDLPVKKGMSSSAAICVLTARAFNQIYNLKLSIEDEMECAYQGEILTPSRCGRMDQGCAFGNQPILMTFDADTLDTKPLKVGRDIHLVVVDLHGQKDTKKILAALNNAYPFSETDLDKGLHALLGKKNKQITKKAIQLLELGDAKQLGKLMTKAQQLFDEFAQPACPEELSSPLLHKVLGYPAVQSHIWGGKGVGSQGDGSAQLIVRSEEDQQVCIEILHTELQMSAIPLTIKAN